MTTRRDVFRLMAGASLLPILPPMDVTPEKMFGYTEYNAMLRSLSIAAQVPIRLLTAEKDE